MSHIPLSSGTIFKKTNRKTGKVVYCAELVIGHKSNGAPVKTRRSFQTKAAAVRGLNQMIADREAGQLSTVRAETVENAALRWIREVKISQVRTSTLSDYECKLRTYLFPHLGNRQLISITGRDIDLWMSQLAREGKSTSTISGARRVAFGFFKYAHRQGLIGRNPVELTDAPKRKSFDSTQVQEPWSIDEALHVLKIAHEQESEQYKDIELFVTIALLLGLRRGEILGLKWTDVDFENNCLHVRRTAKEQRQITKSGAGVVTLVTDDPKTKASIRTLPLAPQTRRALERQAMRQSVAKLGSGNAWEEGGWIFTTKNGNPVRPSNMRFRYLNFLKQNNLRPIRIHDLRHTSAVLALSSGIPLEAVSQGLGHSRIAITKDVYAPNVPKLNEEFGYSLASYFEAEASRLDFEESFSTSLDISVGGRAHNSRKESK